eukprot:TRINITY_DN2914_c0_g1_i1.p1 TRINITY_DN2914_c0_g1~~TRINITY_DN2914_c0_g1_i1.p1  ORF type:complete len:237 (+),score=67.89 TRINITY_DN2914_c0_g1_i1:125-835(+)
MNDLSFVEVDKKDEKDYELGFDESSTKDISFEEQQSKKETNESSDIKNTIASRGLGWLFEFEEENEENQESLVEELDIDIKEIVYKLKCVMMPLKLDSKKFEETPDFWGPIFVVLTYAFLLVWGQLKVLSWIIWVWLLGSLFIFFLGKMIGSLKISFSKVFGGIGYSMVPLILGVAISMMLAKMKYVIFVKLVSVFWSTFSASSMIQMDQVERKKVLLVYPIFLLFLYLISMHGGI